jgi:hypothetical protein
MAKRPFPESPKSKPYYRVTVDKMFPFAWNYSVDAIDGSILMGMFGTSFTEKRAYAKADRAVARYRKRITKQAKPKTIRG